MTTRNRVSVGGATASFRPRVLQGNVPTGSGKTREMRRKKALRVKADARGRKEHRRRNNKLKSKARDWREEEETPPTDGGGGS